MLFLLQAQHASTDDLRAPIIVINTGFRWEDVDRLHGFKSAGKASFVSQVPHEFAHALLNEGVHTGISSLVGKKIGRVILGKYRNLLVDATSREPGEWLTDTQWTKLLSSEYVRRLATNATASLLALERSVGVEELEDGAQRRHRRVEVSSDGGVFGL